MKLEPSLKTFKAGEQIFAEGEPSACMYLVRKGTISIRKGKSKKGGGGGYFEIAKVYANEVLGELSFFDRKPRSAGAVAITEVEVMELTFEKLDPVYSAFPDYMKTIMAAVAERLRKANETIRRLNRELGGGGSPDDDGGLPGADPGGSVEADPIEEIKQALESGKEIK